MLLDDDVVSVLVAGGWFVEREIPTEPMRRGLEDEGIVMHSAAMKILRSLGGLQFHGRNGDLMRFDVGAACKWIDVDDLACVQALFSGSACPVACGEGMLYFVADDGKWFSLHEQWTVCYLMADLNTVLRFSLLGEFDLREAQVLEKHQVPPSYRG
ncbi:SUKH-3 domain-containing protein [Myxococcus llanfairpwllgwyngyllgogerychwyrndrobwllllantysiliogogogochensis]|nr:SUKH-3 domain-containing protein [Myxococcus llanfairpwllgwyngyllgogerychwyrndrobwllllantysiliogogogochensis]